MRSITGHVDSEDDSWASFSNVRGTSDTDSEGSQGGEGSVSSGGSQGSDEDSDASFGHEDSEDEGSKDSADHISDSIISYLSEEWRPLMEKAQRSIEACMREHMEADDHLSESYAELVKQHITDRVSTLLGRELVEGHGLPDGHWRQEAAAAVAHDLVGDTIANNKPSKRGSFCYYDSTSVSRMLRPYMMGQPVTESQRASVASKIFCDVNGNYLKLLRSAELAAGERLASYPAPAADGPVPWAGAATLLAAKELAVHTIIANDVGDALRCGIKEGGAAVYANSRFCFHMPLQLATPFTNMTDADQITVLSRIEPVAVEVARVVNPAGMLSAARPNPDKVTGKVMAQKVAALLRDMLFQPPAQLR
jgi:hypothetical protein